MLNRISNFFNSRRRKSSRSHHSSTSSSNPSSPISPSSSNAFQFEQENDGETPTPTRKAHSSSSNTSVLLPEAELPFADSSGSSQSSVKLANGRKVSTASGDRDSGGVTPTLLIADYRSKLVESNLKEVSKRLRTSFKEPSKKITDDFSKENAVNQTPLAISKNPMSPNLTSIIVASKKTTVVETNRPSEQTDTSDFDEFHKAIWVKTHLDEEKDEWEEESKNVIKEEREDSRASSPPLLALPATVIVEDDSVAHVSTESSPESTLPRGCSKKDSFPEDYRPREITRKTVNLPSKFFAWKVPVIPDQSLDRTEPDRGEDSTTSKTSETKEV